MLLHALLPLAGWFERAGSGDQRDGNDEAIRKKSMKNSTGLTSRVGWRIVAGAALFAMAVVFVARSSLVLCFPFFVLAMFYETSASKNLAPGDLFSRCARVPSDRMAWEEFFRRYRRDIAGAIYRVLGFPPKGRFSHLFDDVLQRFHQRLLENDRRALLSFRGKTEPEARSYLRKIAVGVAIKTLHCEPPAGISIDDCKEDDKVDYRHPADPDGSSEEFIAMMDAIDFCLDKILRGRNKRRNRMIFKLSVLEGCDSKDIVRMPGIRISSSHAVDQLVSRIRSKVCDCLKRIMEDQESA